MPDFVIKLRRSGTTGNAPDVSDLQLGELAVNTYDGKLFLKKDDGTPSVIEVGLGCDLTWTASTRTISSSSGNNAVITNVTTSNSGLMSSTDKSKLDGIAAGAEVNVGTGLSYVANSREIQSSTGGNATLPEVIASSTSGLMTGSDKNKLDGIAAGAEANVGTDLTYTSATRSLNSSTGSNVALPLVGAGGTAGLMSGTDKTKLDSIQSNAEINVKADFNATSGDAQILNKPTIPSNLGDLNNVDSTAPTDGQVLTWDNANSYWEAADAVANSSNADTVDNLHASSFLRSDTSDTMTGDLTVSGRITLGSNLDAYTSSSYWLRVGTSSSTNVIGFTNGNLMLGGTLDATFAATQQPNISLNATNGDATFAGSIECILNSTYKTTIGNNGSIALYGSGGLVTYLENDGTSTFGNTFKVKIRPFNSANADQFQVLNSSGTVTASITGGGAAVFSGNVTVNRLFLGGSSNGGFDYNPTANTLEILTTNGGTHSEFNANAFVPSSNGGKNLGANALRWGTVYAQAVRIDGSLSWHTGNDGAGSGLDADILDGQQGSYYLDYNNFTNVPVGSGGTNADTVDGLHASSFVRSDTSDTMSGTLTVTAIDAGGKTNDRGVVAGNIKVGYLSMYNSIDINDSTSTLYLNPSAAAGVNFNYNNTGSVTVGSALNTVWHAGNDGAGSGLDADSLDGYTWDTSGKNVRANEFYADSWFRNYDSGDGLYNQATGAHFYSDADQTWNLTGDTQNQGVNLKFRGTYNGDIEGWIHADGTGRIGQLTNTGNWFTWSYINQGNSPNLWFLETAGETWTGNPGNDQGKIEYHSNRFYITSGSNSTSICLFRRSGSSVATVENDGRIFAEGSNEVWHAGNDGSGSGLDADLLDGLQGSVYLSKGSSSSYYQPDNWIDFNTTTAGLYWAGGTAAGWHIYPENASNMRFRTSGNTIALRLDTNNGTARGYVYADNGARIGFLNNNGNWRLQAPSSGSLLRDGTQTIWDSGNDGSGSGLDADTLDGAHASSFLQADSNGDILLADGKKLFMSGFANNNTFTAASIFVDGIKCGNLRIHDGKNTSGGSSLQHNTIIGNSARTFGYASGDNNTVVGSFAGYEMTTGHDNTLIGVRAQQKVTTGGYGTFVGVDAGKNKRYGDYCTAIGYRADFYTTSGSSNDTENYSNTTCLGYDSRPSGSNQVVAGDSNTTLHYYGLSNRSDARDKIDIQDEFLGLDFIKKLKPRVYKWDYRDVYFDEVFDEVENPNNPGQLDKEARLVPVPKDGSRSGVRLHHGLIAQEVKEIIDETGVDFAGYQDHKVKDGEDVLSMNYLELIAPMIKAIQEQQVQIDSLTEMIESMK